MHTLLVVLSRLAFEAGYTLLHLLKLRSKAFAATILRLTNCWPLPREIASLGVSRARYGRRRGHAPTIFLFSELTGFSLGLRIGQSERLSLFQSSTDSKNICGAAFLLPDEILSQQLLLSNIGSIERAARWPGIIRVGMWSR